VIRVATKLDYPVFDADNHFYETEDSLTKFLPERYKNAIQYVQVKGRTKIAVRGVISEYIPNPTFEVVARPGAQEDYFANGNPEGKSYRELMGEPMKAIPAFREPAARLELLDELNIDRTLMFPTLASLAEERMKDDPLLTHAVIHALNEWMYETWTFDFDHRIYATPVITLPIVEKAIEELEWCLERGARTVLVRPAPVPGFQGTRSPGLPEFDPFWQRVVEAGIPVSMHASDAGYADYLNVWENAGEYTPFAPNAFRMTVQGKRPIIDAMAAMVCHGAFDRNPGLKILCVENGGDWVDHLFTSLKDTYRKMPQAFHGDPIEAFTRSVWVSPFHEDDFVRLIELIGTDHVLFGSDYPHPEGLSDPCHYPDYLPYTLSDDEVRDIMGGNLARAMNLPVAV
jgi:predicted TIM-barrel fold metal-dependent hydrolase